MINTHTLEQAILFAIRGAFIGGSIAGGMILYMLRCEKRDQMERERLEDERWNNDD